MGEPAVALRIVATRVRGQAQYRASFVLGCVSDVLSQGTELLAIVVLFTQIDALGGFSRSDVLLMYALAAITFGMAELFFAELGSLPYYIRTGELDVLLMRPVGVLTQLVTSDVQLRRISRVVVGLGVLGYVLATTAIDWTAAKVGLLLVAPPSGAVIIAAIWVVSAAVSFWVIDGQEVTTAVTYGTNLMTSYPLTVFPSAVRGLLAYLLPTAFVAYYPVLGILDRPDPLGGPPLLSWISPVAAAVAALAAGAFWSRALLRYQGTGS